MISRQTSPGTTARTKKTPIYTRDRPTAMYKSAIQERAEVWARNAEISLATIRNCVRYTSNGALQAVFDRCFASGKEAIGYNDVADEAGSGVVGGEDIRTPPCPATEIKVNKTR
ncbi:hypothetical protein O988_00656 [Pseudogymnoascus sp. VKM F-3808]|nr:hypothetical protein O988_00656 [Pseudogymnoascus sp. VKM F-3808]